MIEIIYSIVGIQIIISLFVIMGVLTYNSVKEHFNKDCEEEIERLKSKNFDLEIELSYYKSDD